MKTTLTTTIILLFTQFCFAQDFWVELSKPTGGTIFSFVAKDKNEIFAGMGNGVYISHDDTEAWEHIGLEGITVYSLHIHQNGSIFAGTGGFNSIYRLSSFDAGWVPVFSCVPNIISMASNSNRDIFAGSGHDYGLLRSINNGKDWERIITLDDTEQTNAIVTKENNQIFIGTTDFLGGGGVYRSFDNGDNWEKVGLNNKFISSLAINSNGLLFAGSRGDYEYGGGGVFRSNDNGITWEDLAYNVWVTSMAIDPYDVLYIGCTNEHGGQGGVFRSMDNGESWELVVSGMGNYPDVDGLFLAPDGYLYAYGNHLHRSVEPVFTPNYIDNSVKSEIKIFPNPFIDFLNIVLPNALPDCSLTNITIYDILGNSVLNQKFYNQNSFTVNLSYLNAGFYYVIIETNGQRFSKPIMKA